MIPRPNNRAVAAADTVTRVDGRARGVVGAAPISRPAATRAQILGRDPKREDVFTGGTGLIQRQPKSESE